MSAIQPSTAKRNANLDKLLAAANEWAAKEQSRLENEVKFMRSVLSGRGSTKTGTGNLATIKPLIEAEIDEFLIG
jgi:hypothetical protein